MGRGSDDRRSSDRYVEEILRKEELKRRRELNGREQMRRRELRRREELRHQEELRRKKQKKKRRRRRRIIGTLLVIAAILAAFVWFELGKLNTTKLNHVENHGFHQNDYQNIALFGVDARTEGESARSDSIIIASIHKKTKEVKMVSVYRDTFLKVGDTTYDKANSAYAYGGPEQAVNMLNRNLDLDIEDYISVNFLALADVVDELGGIELELTDEEVVHMNNYCVETSEVTGKSYERIEPEVAGTYHLNGVQAVSFSRIRYTAGGDFTRASRQRIVIEKIMEKAKRNPWKLNGVINQVFPEVSTSLSRSDILRLGFSIFRYSIGESKGFPTDTALPESIPGYSGSYVVPVGLKRNVEELHAFLFPGMNYEATETVQQIDQDISYLTGIYP